MCGFRGFRTKTPIAIPRGFAVLTGRNGSGKSTICDAVEFVLTGTIDKYATEKGGKESLADYIWWRGEGNAAEHYVTVVFGDDEGKTIKVTRSRSGATTDALAELERALCNVTTSPPNALQHLCKTSIIRDELIAASSLDLADPARFEFVRSALGAVAHGDLFGRVHKAGAIAQEALGRAEKESELARTRMHTTLAELADARAATSRVVDLEAAMNVLRGALGEQARPVAEMLAAGRLHIAQRRAALRQGAELAEGIRRFDVLRQQVSSEEFRAGHTRATAQLEAAAKEYEIAAKQLSDAEALLAQAREGDATAAAVSNLLEAGAELGLYREHCPLCGVQRSEVEYAKALDQLRARLATMSAAVARGRDRVSELRPKVSTALVALQKARAEADSGAGLIATVEAKGSELLAQWRAFAADHTAVPSAAEMESRVAVERDQLLEIERSALILEASQAVDRVSQLEALVETIRSVVDTAGNRVAAAQSAVQALDAAEKSVKRVNAEMVDERLASISPLLSELYYRLRPHENWREIDYAIRGDVRRFLSLRVGEGLNPQFIFSSGQRRAAGLAFLLAVHLSRPWCEWRTLLLDDPVQHIDDFRALQLVEVLSALRKTDRQLICAVEDPALADVLCRRFRSTPESPGARVELGYQPTVGGKIVRYDEIRPFPQAILRSVGVG
jgi:chromosome segregation protein